MKNKITRKSFMRTLVMAPVAFGIAMVSILRTKSVKPDGVLVSSVWQDENGNKLKTIYRTYQI